MEETSHNVTIHQVSPIHTFLDIFQLLNRHEAILSTGMATASLLGIYMNVAQRHKSSKLIPIHTAEMMQNSYWYLLQHTHTRGTNNLRVSSQQSCVQALCCVILRWASRMWFRCDGGNEYAASWFKCVTSFGFQRFPLIAATVTQRHKQGFN